MPNEPNFDFGVPGGQLHDLWGPNLNSVVITPSRRYHHYVTTAAITTIVPPWEGFAGPFYLEASSVFTITSSGNIATPGFGATIIAGHLIGFVYDRKLAKWYALGQ